jgi:hypothetical protein
MCHHLPPLPCVPLDMLHSLDGLKPHASWPRPPRLVLSLYSKVGPERRLVDLRPYDQVKARRARRTGLRCLWGALVMVSMIGFGILGWGEPHLSAKMSLDLSCTHVAGLMKRYQRCAP